MPPRLGCSLSIRVASPPKRSQATRPWTIFFRSITTTSERQYAAAAAATTGGFHLPDNYVSPTKPPSARPVETRKSQLLRTYTSLLRSTPLMLFYEYNNLTALEWAAVRRELRKALSEVEIPAGATSRDVTREIQLQALRTRMFTVAMKIVEFFDPEAAARDPRTRRTASGPLVHDLSMASYEAIKGVTAEAEKDSVFAQLSPQMTGPMAALVFPAVWPGHLAAALGVLSPAPPTFPAPKKKDAPGYYEPLCQSGLQKLRLVGGRIEGKAFDLDGVKWVGGIRGGIDGLRAQIVNVLQGAGLGVTSALEGTGRNLWMGLEGRRMALEEEQKGTETKDGEGKS